MNRGSAVSFDVPQPPEFGQPAPLPRPSPELLAMLAQRRSASPQHLAEPAPSAMTCRPCCAWRPRADHGKLFPWRFITAAGADKLDLVRRLEPWQGPGTIPKRPQASCSSCAIRRWR